MDQEINIVKLDWHEAIRTRSGMYIGGTENPSVLLREAIDNSIDELYGNNTTTKIYIDTTKAWKVVADNGRGIPISWDDKYNMTKTELAVTSTHTGSKFNKTDVAIGLNGVGLSATNALSSDFIVLSRITELNYNNSIPEVRDFYNNNPNNIYYYIHFSKGIKQKEGAINYTDIESNFGFNFPPGMMTITAFIPDDTIFQSTEVSIPTKNLSYVHTIMDKIYHRRITIEVNGSDVKSEFEPYKYEFIKTISMTKGDEERTATFYINFQPDNMMSVSEASGSVNSLVCNRGTHIEVAKSAYTDALKMVYGITHPNIFCGIRLNVILIASDVDFSSQTKERCTRIENFLFVQMASQLIPEFKRIMKRNNDEFSSHVERLNEYISSLTKISTINKIKNALATVGSNGARVQSKIPKSVRDAAINDRNQAELFIVEGKSASGSILNTRDSRTQAVFELRGIPMNTINRDLDEIFDNEEMRSLISAIGAGVNEYFDINLARYGKIIIAADADPDGLKIASMVAGMIAKKMTFLIEKGMVYILRSPLFIQDGKFIYPEDTNELDQSKPYTRIKGLGELRDDQAETIITNANTRRLYQLTLEDVEHALSLLTVTSARKMLMIDNNIVTDPFNLGLWY